MSKHSPIIRWGAVALALSTPLAAAWAADAPRTSKFQRSNGSGTERFLARLKSELKLNAQQQQSVQELLNAQRQSLSTLRQGSNEQMNAVRSETDRKIRAVLDPAQQTAFDRYQERRKSMPSRFGQGKRSPSVAKANPAKT